MNEDIKQEGESFMDKLKQKAADLEEKAAHAWDFTKEKAGEWKDKASAEAGILKDKAENMKDAAVNKFDEMRNDSKEKELDEKATGLANNEEELNKS